MKNAIFISISFALLVSCSSGSKADAEKNNIIYQPEDKQILEEVFELFENEKNEPIGTLIIKVGMFFTGTPYVAHTLETEPEQLVVNLREMDCTTFAEYCLAIARTIKRGKPSFENFAEELKDVRYRNGKIDGYPSRLHYFSDWISNNDKMGIVKDVSKEIAETPYSNQVNFMSKHPAAYEQLNDSAELVKEIARQEKEISARDYYYIPEDKVAEVEDQLKDGDIAGITTEIDGLDIAHVVILMHKGGRIHILHGSSAANKVVVSDDTLEEYLKNSKSGTGIMVARPL